jgi:hypothetical protein
MSPCTSIMEYAWPKRTISTKSWQHSTGIDHTRQHGICPLLPDTDSFVNADTVRHLTFNNALDTNALFDISDVYPGLSPRLLVPPRNLDMPLSAGPTL